VYKKIESRFERKDGAYKVLNVVIQEMSSLRDFKLQNVSKMVVNGEVVFKLDFIAAVYINNYYFFNVFRRYNSPYNIVIEDMHGDIHLHQDRTIRASLARVFCLNEDVADHLYVRKVTSYAHNGPAPSGLMELTDMRWTEVQARYQAVDVHFEGILPYYPSASTATATATTTATSESAPVSSPTPPSTPRSQMIPPFIEPPPAPIKAKKEQSVSDEDNEIAEILLSLNKPRITIPSTDDSVRECDGPTLSMRWSDVLKRKRSCFCEMDSESASESASESESESEYMVLRNGVKIPKLRFD
jgi:hypothetical protein